MTTVTASTDTTNTNAGEAFKIAVTGNTTSNINTAYGSLGSFPYMTSADQPDATNVAGLYMKVWQDSTMYTAIKNGWSVVSGSANATTVKAFSTAMSSATDPWSDYRFAILNKIDMSAYATEHAAKFTFRSAAPTSVTAWYHDHFVGYCIYQDTFGGLCAEASVTTSWNNHLEFLAPKEAPTFQFAAARFKKAAKILTVATATTTEFTPVSVIDVNKALTGASPTIVAATATEFVGVDSFVGSSEIFGASRRAQQTTASIAKAANDSASGNEITCTADTAAGCGTGTSGSKYSALLATTNLDYAPSGQSGFNMIGAGASYKAGAMWTYLWGWVATTTTTAQTGGNDLTFESNVKFIDWAVKRDITIADGTGAAAGGVDGVGTTCNSADTTASTAVGCKATAGKCLRACKTFAAVAVPIRTPKDLTVTRVAMSGSSLVASAAAAIVAASLAF